MIAIPDLAEKIIKHRTSDGGGLHKPSGHRASGIGMPCARFLVHAQRDWDKSARINDGLLLLFKEGHLHEREIMADLATIGAEVWGQQDSKEWRGMNITGHPDGKIYLQDGSTQQLAIVEIKSTNSQTFRKICVADDLLGHSLITRKWYAQCQIYMMLFNCEHCLMLLKDRQWGGIKQINIELNLDYTEVILKRVELANQHLKEGTWPDKINDPAVCNKCWQAHNCMPDMIATATMGVIDNEELEDMVTRIMELKEAFKEHNSLDRAIKNRLPREVGEFILGTFLIKQTQVDKKEYTVKASSYITRKFESIELQTNDTKSL